MTAMMGEQKHLVPAQQRRSLSGYARRASVFVTAAAFASAAIGMPKIARADEVSPDGKGIAGGALLGAEVVTIPMALFKVRSPWAYVIGGGLGAVGGGVAGHFIEQGSVSNDGRLPTYMLAGGLGLVIPAVVLVLNATRYQPPEEPVEDHAPTNGPAADPGKVGGSMVLEGGGSTSQPSTPPPSTTPTKPPSGGGTPPMVPMSLLDLHQGFRMGIPVPEVHETYTLAQRKALGLPQITELRLPVFRATF